MQHVINVKAARRDKAGAAVIPDAMKLRASLLLNEVCFLIQRKNLILSTTLLLLTSICNLVFAKLSCKGLLHCTFISSGRDSSDSESEFKSSDASDGKGGAGCDSSSRRGVIPVSPSSL